MKEFQRERRYVVIKIKDMEAALTVEEIDALGEIQDKIDSYRESRGKEVLLAAVVEHDWPEYEPTWKAIEMRMQGMGEG